MSITSYIKASVKLESLGNILYVSANAPIGNNTQSRADALGRIDKPFQSIQSAVNVANGDLGDIIYILAGTYNENISISKSIRSFILDNAIINGLINFNIPSTRIYTKTIIQGIGFAIINSNLITLNCNPAGVSIHRFEFRNLEINAEYNYNNSENRRTVSYFNCRINKTADYVSSTDYIRVYNCIVTAENKNKYYMYHEYYDSQITFANGVGLNANFSTIFAKNCIINFGNFLFSEGSTLANLRLDGCEVVVGKFRQITGYANSNAQIFELRNCKITETDTSQPYIFTHQFIAGDWYLGSNVTLAINFCTSNKLFYDVSKPLNVIDKINFLTTNI